MDVFTSNKDDTIKAGLKQNTYYLLKRAANLLRTILVSEGRDDLSKNIKCFIDLLELWDDIIFADAIYDISKRRETYLRKPEQLPKEEDMKIIRDHVLSRMSDLSENVPEFFTAKKYVDLRDVSLSKLTIINGWRDGEPSRLLISDWKMAQTD